VDTGIGAGSDPERPRLRLVEQVLSMIEMVGGVNTLSR
jgi:hypothetical protein